jgi:hypothetical protein
MVSGSAALAWASVPEWPRKGLEVAASASYEQGVVKSIPALALFAVLALTVAGCGATKKIAFQVDTAPARLVFGKPIMVVGPTTTTIAHVKTGTRIGCTDWDARLATVPPRGDSDGVREGGARTGSELEMTHQENGSVTASCKRPKQP